jgi:hypothetical protein
MIMLRLGVFVRLVRVVMNMLVRMLMTFMVVMAGIRRMMSGVMCVAVAVFAMRMIMMFMIARLGGLRWVGTLHVHDLALHALAVSAAARVALARPAVAARPVFGFFLGLAVGAFVSLDQRLTVGDRNLVIVGVDFAEGQKAVPIAAVFDERGLQRGLYARDLGEIDIAAQLLALGGFEIKFFDAIAAHHDNPGLFRVGGIDQHFVGHFGTLDGGGRANRQAHVAPPGDATVHLIRG